MHQIYQDSRMTQKNVQQESFLRSKTKWQLFTHIFVRDGKQTGHPMCRGRFTLIELLVVIAIISILASMLLPSLQKAKNEARRSSCLNSLKQTSQAIFAYSSDFDSYLPASTITTSSLTYWYNKNSKRLTPGYIPAEVSHYGCPTRPEGSHGIGTYAMNRCIAGDMTHGAYPCSKIESIQNSSEKIIITDSPEDDWGYAIDNDGWIDRLGSCHNGGFNALFMDGHVNYFNLNSRGQMMIEGSAGPLRVKHIKK